MLQPFLCSTLSALSVDQTSFLIPFRLQMSVTRSSRAAKTLSLTA